MTAIEPAPISDLLELVEEYPDLEVVEETSLEALEHLPIADAVVLDGDHNYYTLSNELRLIAERAPEGGCRCSSSTTSAGRSPAATSTRRPDRIPAEHRHPYGEDIKLVPGNPGTAERGLPFEWGALEEGGPRNGVMTAIEDFMAEHDGLRLAVIPIFFGCGLLWPEDAPWSDEVAEITGPGTATRSSSGSRRLGSRSSCSGTRASRRSTSASTTRSSWRRRSGGSSPPARSARSSRSHGCAAAASRRSRGRSSRTARRGREIRGDDQR